VLAVQEFVANGGGSRQGGAARVLHRRGGRQSWPCRSAWMLAFHSGSGHLLAVDRCQQRRPARNFCSLADAVVSQPRPSVIALLLKTSMQLELFCCAVRSGGASIADRGSSAVPQGRS
jgi:hypothetical protein